MKPLLLILLTLSPLLSAREPLPPAALAELDRIIEALPPTKHSPDTAVLIIAKAAKVFRTDGKPPQYVTHRDISISGKPLRCVAYDGVTVGTGCTRTAEEQRFLELNDLVLTFQPKAGAQSKVVEISPAGQPVSAAERAVYRSRIRYIAMLLEADISNMERFWMKYDITEGIQDTKSRVDTMIRKQRDALFLMQQPR